MTEILRQSPVSFSARPLKTENRDLWPVVLEYEKEKTGQYIVDLSHVCRWDVQDAKLSKLKPAEVSIPVNPGDSVLSDGVLINRMNRTQASVWQFAKKKPELPELSMYTDTSEATIALAIIGDKVFSIAEKLSSLDFLDVSKKAPFLIQGPFAHLPCQIAVLSKDEGLEGMLLTCSRGYGHVMTEAILHAGEEFGLLPAGENKFTKWIAAITKKS